MPDTVTKAIDRLNKILPLKRNQQNLDNSLKKLHLDILSSYVEKGRSLTRDEIAQRVDDIDIATATLQKNDMVVFDDKGEPVGAYPFTMEKREHKIDINGHLVHSMCALDSLAVSPMYGTELVINSVCHVTGEPVTIRQNGFEITNAPDVSDVYFGINWNAASANSCCADSLCTEMIFLKGDAVADSWLKEDAENRQIFNLPHAVKFADGFFSPLLH